MKIIPQFNQFLATISLKLLYQRKKKMIFFLYEPYQHTLQFQYLHVIFPHGEYFLHNFQPILIYLLKYILEQLPKTVRPNCPICIVVPPVKKLIEKEKKIEWKINCLYILFSG